MHPRVVDILACPIHNTFFRPLATPKLFTRAAFKEFLTNFHPQLWEKTLFKIIYPECSGPNIGDICGGLTFDVEYPPPNSGWSDWLGTSDLDMCASVEDLGGNRIRVRGGASGTDDLGGRWGKITYTMTYEVVCELQYVTWPMCQINPTGTYTAVIPHVSGWLSYQFRRECGGNSFEDSFKIENLSIGNGIESAVAPVVDCQTGKVRVLILNVDDTV